MRWWLQTSPPYLMSVDNASTTGMDFTDLLDAQPDIWMVQWTEGKGEIERLEIDENNEAQNLNGLRESFIDVTPYVPLFQQFLQLMKAKNLLLDQAKKIQVELINELFDSKRQLPFHYPIAAGDYWWDASDETLFASLVPALQNTIASVNGIVDKLNGLVGSINSQDAIIVTRTNAMVDQINARIVVPNRSMHSDISGAYVLDQAYYLAAHVDEIRYYLNMTLVGDASGGVSGPNTINNRLRQEALQAYTIGLIAAIAAKSDPSPGYSFTADLPAEDLSTNVDHLAALSAIPWSPPIPHVPTSNMQWIPIGATEPVTVTPEEQAAIINGIAARTNELNLVRNQKIADVNALTTVDDVIAYDVLADWPIIELPPGWQPLTVRGNKAGSVAIIGTPPAPTEGIPEAPSTGITYGRRNQAWNPALALSGDILDGGNF